MKYPKISIVTPSYNQGCFLEETILSVLNQNYPNFEYIIIDGGSTDNSIDIIRKYERYLTFWISEKDKGQSEAINKGFRHCTGDIIGWINSDDIYTPGAFNFVAEYFINHPSVDMIYGDAEIIDKEGKFIMHRKEIPFDRTMGLLIGFGMLIPQPTAFWRQKIFDSIGFLDEELHYAMDANFWARISEEHIIKHVPKLLAKSRYHSLAKTIDMIMNISPQARKEEQMELERGWRKLPISKFIPFRYSGIIRRLYRLKRIFQRAIKGHYFTGYKPTYYFKRSKMLLKNLL